MIDVSRVKIFKAQLLASRGITNGRGLLLVLEVLNAYGHYGVVIDRAAAYHYSLSLSM